MEKIQFTESSISNARLSCQNNDYGKSFAYYLLALKLSPELKENLRKEFGDVFREWVQNLWQENRSEDVFKCYEQALDAFPENELVHDVMGAHLYRLGFAEEAFIYFQQAMKLNPDLHSAKESFYNLSNSLVERWHFRMLNDNKRNMAFKEAINRAIRNINGPTTVLDIGTGTGILSMFAVEGGASKVYACEMSKTMTSIAQDVLRANQKHENVQLLQMKSTDMRIPEHIPHRVSLVVTETLDSGLLGEGIIETVHHAWTHLLQPPDNQGRVIPGGAAVYAMIVECEHIRKSHRYCTMSIFLYCSYFLRLLSLSVGNIDLNFSIVSDSVNMVQQDMLNEETPSSEPYTSEDISTIPGGYTALSESFKVYDFDFNNPKEMAALFSGNSQSNSLVVPVVQQGSIDAIIMWFDLLLDSQTNINTSPWSESCWENAVYPISSMNIKGMLDVKSGDSVYLNVVCKDNHVAFHNIEVKSLINGNFETITKPTYDVNKSSLPQNQMELSKQQSPADDGDIEFQISSQKASTSKVLVMGEKDIFTLNDQLYQFQIFGLIEKAVLDTLKDNNSSKTQRNSHDGCCKVLDMSEGASLAVVHAANAGATRIHVSSKKGADLLVHLCKDKGYNLGMADLQDLILEKDSSSSWDILVVDVVEPCGLLQQNVWQNIALARNTILKPNGIIIPSGITIYGMCIDSKYILENSLVMDNGRTLDLNIKPFMNFFMVPTHPGIFFSTLQCTHLSAAIKLCHLNLCDLNSVGAPVNIERHQEVKMVADGCLMAVVYWFDLDLGPGKMVSTLDQSTHFSQSVYILPKQTHVRAGEIICLSFNLEDCSISFQVSN
ncbi:protein arginine N-methyltransferase 9-like [Antedon mediterranea]|uniref:protein arginine N-methyltransferase 9-like n=1 Tax=Antedon mediterranea TaxID=105859 RepID=UPI003AF68C76